MLGSIVGASATSWREERCARNALLIFSLRASTWSLVIEGWRETARTTIRRAITSLTWGAGREEEISREVPPLLLLDFHHRLAKRPWPPPPAVPHDSPPTTILELSRHVNVLSLSRSFSYRANGLAKVPGLAENYRLGREQLRSRASIRW